jgi:enterobacterial common antigen flippase
LVTVALNAVRTKALALMLGPSGVGLIGVYNSLLELAKGVANMGTATSGVREIAEVAGSGDSAAFSRTVQTLRRTLIGLGILGALLFLGLSGRLSRFSFGDDRHSTSLAVLSFAVFLGAVSTGQTTVVQGTRRMGDLARISIFGALFNLLVSLPIIYFYRQRGIVPSLVCVSVLGLLTSWWYTRKVPVDRV